MWMDKIFEALKYAKHIDIAPVNKMWQRILDQMEMPLGNFDNALQVTGYHARSSKFLDSLESALKMIFTTVRVHQVENAPWRRIFLCENGEERLLLCVSWYSTGPDF